MKILSTIAAPFLLIGLVNPAVAQPAPESPQKEPPYSQLQDVVYGRRAGVALTMDVFTPKNANGLGVIIFVSAEYRSGRDLLERFHPTTSLPFLNRGYTVFQVMHGSQPKYTVVEILEDANRAVRFIKYNASRFNIDPDRIGVAGASSGGHLCLMMGCAGGNGNVKADDPVDRESSRVAAVACFFPPTDFLKLQGMLPRDIAAAFDFREMDQKTGLMERVTAQRRLDIGKTISPITYVHKDSAPTLIIHGDRDPVVPISQSESMIRKLEECRVECRLQTMKGKEHHGLWVVLELPKLADWFDKQLLAKKPAGKAAPVQRKDMSPTQDPLSGVAIPGVAATFFVKDAVWIFRVPADNESYLAWDRLFTAPRERSRSGRGIFGIEYCQDTWAGFARE